MSKIYLVSHKSARFMDDFSYLSHSPVFCSTCGIRVDVVEPPLEYEWDDEFGCATISIQNDHQYYWGEFMLIVTASGRDFLKRIIGDFHYYETSPVKTKLVRHDLVIEHLPQPKDALYWALPTRKVSASVSGTPNELCNKCGKFVTHPRQLTRLRVDEKMIPSNGIFSVCQNRSPQIFVTEETKEVLIAEGIDAGFYSAGKTY